MDIPSNSFNYDVKKFHVLNIRVNYVHFRMKTQEFEIDTVSNQLIVALALPSSAFTLEVALQKKEEAPPHSSLPSLSVYPHLPFQRVGT